MPLVRFLPYEIALEVPRGTHLLAAADEAAESVPGDFFVGELCEGRHECGNCCVEIVEGAEHLSEATPSEQRLLEVLGRGDAVRTCCTVRVYGDVTVRILAPVEYDDAEGARAQMQAHP